MSDESEQPRPSQPTQVGVALLGPSAPEPADTGQGGGADDIDVDVDDGPGVRLSTGKVIPGTRYRLIRWLGEGGMGVVYEAEHVDIERRVALKILRVDLSKRAEMAQIFRDEARAASRMGSPFIVDIYDFGELPDGRLFFCMELLDGNDLVPPSEEAWTPPERAIPILRQICKALSTAHGAGVVHRDVKPENIIVVRRGGREHVKIVDFGIAAMLAVGPRRRLKIAGTPHYMAPEQILGKPFDGRLDMYAVGCLAYELLVGHTPFTGETMDAVMTAQVHDDPPPLAKLRPERRLPPALCAAVMRCLAKRPEDRFRDMNDLEAALCEAQIAAGLRTDWDDLPLPEVEPERLARLRRDMPHPHGELRRRHPWLWPAVAALSGVIAISSITYAYMNREPTSDEQRLVDQLTNAARAAASTNYYITGPEEAPEESALRSVLALESLGGAVAGLASERAAELRRDFADTLIRLGDRYYDVEGARYFAIEYYLWARTFDPENRHAIERSLLDDTRFGVFLHNAGAGDFTATERQLMELASALAEDNTAKRDARITAVTAKMPEMLRDRLALRSVTLESEAGIHIARRVSATKPPEFSAIAPPPTLDTAADTDTATDTDADTDTGTGEPSPTTLEPLPAPQPGPVIEPNPASKSAKVGGAAVNGKTKRDPPRAIQLAQEGQLALAGGRRSDAESLFNQALSYDNRNATALMGLSDIAFDTGKRQRALDFAAQAVEASPRSKAYQLKLGDAYFALLRYREALRHYELAKGLGEPNADGRIAKVKAKLGDG
jgi:serine/threonine protein kinase